MEMDGVRPEHPKLPTVSDIRQLLRSLCCCTAPPKTMILTCSLGWRDFWHSAGSRHLLVSYRAEKTVSEGLLYSIFQYNYSEAGLLGFHQSFAPLKDMETVLRAFCASFCLFKEKAIILLQKGAENILPHIYKSVREPSVTTGTTCRVFCFITAI